MKRAKSIIRSTLILAGACIALTGCYYTPAPYGYAPGYYGPGYAYGPPVTGSVVIGGGYGRGWGHGWR